LAVAGFSWWVLLAGENVADREHSGGVPVSKRVWDAESPALPLFSIPRTRGAVLEFLAAVQARLERVAAAGIGVRPFGFMGPAVGMIKMKRVFEMTNVLVLR
jgi:hypothetical protein